MSTPADHNLTPHETLAKADSVLPRFDSNDEPKRAYLSYRLCGFGRQEACNYSGTTKRRVYYWMATDVAFARIEHQDLVDLRHTFAKQVITLDFTRNFKLALERDKVILERAVTDSASLTKTDHEYLNKIRAMYTPQQLQILEGFFRTEADDMSFDEIIIRARRYYGKDSSAGVNADALTSGEEEYPKGSIIEAGLTRREEEENVTA
tara:strand:+ start:2005 stop:2625 length:621 start_codon:yes stop_codon:yes gene_type:complete